MPGYYSRRLSAEKLKRCYDIAPPAVRRYLDDETGHVTSRIGKGDSVLELGCGYGRILPEILKKTSFVTGIDNSIESLKYGRANFGFAGNCGLCAADAIKLPFKNEVFDVIVCIQNGISAFHTDPVQLIRESIRILRSGGTAFFSTYSEKFWDHRLEWFELQSKEGLLGEIDHEKTGDGNIVCKDGFTARTFSEDELLKITADLPAEVSFVEVGGSSLFCEISPVNH